MSTPSDERPDAQPVEDPYLRGDTVERPAVRDEVDDESRLRLRPLRPRDEVVEDDELDDDELDDEEAPLEDQGPHPVAVPLAGFFTGMAYVLLLPVLWFWLSDPTIGDLISKDLVYFVPAILVPVALAIAPRTRRFGRYMLGGVLLSAVVVLGVAAVVLSFLIFTGR